MRRKGMKTLSVAEAKKRFSAIADEVSHGRRFEITRRGKPLVALVPVEEARELEERGGAKPLGLAAVLGALEDAPEVLDGALAAWRSRRKAKDRPAPKLHD